jgi:hypothetical protein
MLPSVGWYPDSLLNPRLLKSETVVPPTKFRRNRSLTSERPCQVTFAPSRIKVHAQEVGKMAALSTEEIILPSYTRRYTKTGNGNKWHNR